MTNYTVEQKKSRMVPGIFQVIPHVFGLPHTQMNACLAQSGQIILRILTIFWENGKIFVK